MDKNLSALLGAALGAVIVKFFDYFLKKPNQNFREAMKIREELREDIESLRYEIQKYSEELDEWKKKYYELLTENIKLEAMCINLSSQMEALKCQVSLTRQEL